MSGEGVPVTGNNLRDEILEGVISNDQNIAPSRAPMHAGGRRCIEFSQMHWWCRQRFSFGRQAERRALRRYLGQVKACREYLKGTAPRVPKSAGLRHPKVGPPTEPPGSLLFPENILQGCLPFGWGSSWRNGLTHFVKD
jgi:hypothetical protein